jgi:osmotically-inducible protein OsmY
MRSDAAIQRQVIEEIRAHGWMPDAAIGVGVERAVVTLSGEVADRGVQAAASDVAHRVPGVLDVVNHLEMWRPRGEHVSDTDVAEAVRQRLVFVAGARHGAILSTVSHGSVVLDGIVQNDAVREGLVDAVAALPGVVAVVSHLHVPCPEDGPDDAARC